MIQKKIKNTIFGLIILSLLIIYVKPVSGETVQYIDNSFSFPANQWRAQAITLNESDQIIVTWNTYTPSDIVEVSVLEKNDYDTFLSTGNVVNPIITGSSNASYFEKNVTKTSLYFVVFKNDNAFGVYVGFHIIVSRNVTSTQCNCDCDCNCSNGNNVSEFPGISDLLSFGLMGLGTIAIMGVIIYRLIQKRRF